MKSEYLTCRNIAEMTGVKLRTVWRWCNSGKLKANRPTGTNGPYFVKRSDFEAFMEGGSNQTDSTT